MLSHSQYSYILWHILLFTILLMIFHDSRHGFRKTISYFVRTVHWLKLNSNENAINYKISKYKERSKKVYLSDVLLPVIIVLVIALVLYLKLIFFTVVISDSMDPTLKKGDLVLVQNIIVKPEIGDIITFQVPGEQLPVMHRIISISGKEIRTKGDANPSEDSWRITTTKIRGKIVYISGKPAVIRNLGNYFLVDASKNDRTYGPEFNAVSNLIKGVKAAGIIIFIACIVLYLVFSFRDSRRTR